MAPAESSRPDDERGPTQDPHREPPSYDAGIEGYVGISDGALYTLQGLHDARGFAEMIVDTVREGLLVLDFDLRVRAANESFYRMFDVQPEETIGSLVYDLGNGQWDLPDLRRLLEQILPRNEVFNGFEVDHAFEGIGRRVMVLNARRLNDHRLILLAIEDVTEQREEEQARQQIERSLRESEIAFDHLADAVPHLVWVSDAEGSVDYYNQQSEHYDGILRREGGTWEWTPVLHPDDVERTMEAWQHSVETGAPYEVEHRVRMTDGTYRWHISRARPGRDAQGRIVRWYGSATDVHGMKEAEAALRENAERLQRAQQAAHVGTWDVDLETGEVTWSEGVFDLVGLPPEGGVPSSDAWAALLHPEDRERVLGQVQAVIAGGDVYENEFRVVRPDGEVVWVAAKGHVLRDEAGRPRRLLGANYDITPRKRTEEALRRMNETLEERVEERTRQVRALSRSLALAEQEERRRIAHVLHDGLQQSLFGAQIAAASGDTERVEAILDEAMEVARTLSHSLSPPFLEGEDVEDLLRWLAERHRLRYGMEVEVEATGDVPVPDPALRVLLFQIVRELLFNVVKHAGTDRVRLVAKRSDGYVCIVIEDRGAGFDPRDLEQSTGLGLRSVRERVDLVGGRFSIDSAPGAGTRIALTLPADGTG